MAARKQYIVKAEVEVLVEAYTEDEAASDTIRLLDGEADIITGMVIEIRETHGHYVRSRLAELQIEDKR